MSSFSPSRESQPLSQREQDLLARLFSDPTLFPMTFKAWLVSYIGMSDLSLPVSAISGLSLRLSGLVAESAGTFTFKLDSGQTLTVLNASGNPIFRVDEDGDLHGLTGKALTFDL